MTFQLPPHEFLELLAQTTAVRVGATAHGMSNDERATDCGMKSAFAGVYQERATVYPMQFFDAKGKPVVIGTRAGTAFHGLQEMWKRGQISGPDLPEGKAFADVDVALEAGLDSFKRYREQQRHAQDWVGTSRGTEVPVAGTIAGQHRTARIDDVVEATEEQTDRWADYGIFFAEPGLYLWDYKLLKAVTVAYAEKYARSMQPLAYMELYRQTTGITPKGFIFDLVSRAKKPTIDRMLAIVPWGAAHARVIEDFVTEAEVERQAGKARPSHCDNQFGVCPFITVCPRYGTANEHSQIIEDFKKRQSGKEILIEGDEL